MKQFRSPRKRHATRYSFSSEFRGQELSWLGRPKPGKHTLQGAIQNISAGGLGLLTNRPVKELAIFRGEIRIPSIPVAVPSLLQARWVKRGEKRSQYRVGFEFLL